jgi:hypothetical protein
VSWRTGLDWLRAHGRWLRLLPAGLAVLALLVLVARNADTPSFPDYEVPEGFVPAPPPTTAVPGAELPSLAAVRGTTTTTVPPNAGRVRVFGYVTGPDGAPVAGAVVRFERVVGGVTQVFDAATTGEGFYDATGLGGGRYRVRAFLAPTFAQPSGEVLYLRHDEERSLDLRVEAFAEPVLSIAVAPNPPLLDDAVNLAVRVSGRVVDADGFVRTGPLAGALVQVSSTGGWSTPVPSSATTGGDGQAQFRATCLSTSPAQVHLTVRAPGAVPGAPATTATFDVPACVDPATLTTTTSTTAPGASTSSSTSTTTG